MYKGTNESDTIADELHFSSNIIDNKPFLKWAGGKTQLLKELCKYIPENYNKYIEPFIGGGAMFFNLNANESIIADANEELTITYREIKEHVEDIINILKNFEHNEDFYYELRKMSPPDLNDNFRAARLIYLNKTCYNGLYRVNKKGDFNVPYGKGKGNFYNEEVLRNASKCLQNTTIINGDYLNVLKRFAEPNDFIFLDPPYYPVTKYSDFKRYTKEFFYHEDHINLKDEFERLVRMGCHVVLTNSDHPVVLDLYRDYEVKIIETKRLISSNSNTRNGKDVIVIGRNN